MKFWGGKKPAAPDYPDFLISGFGIGDFPAEQPRAPPGERLFLFNLGLLIVLGTAVTMWIMRFTDSLQDVVTTLALGGGLSWFAFVFRIIPAGFVGRFQSGFAAVLGHWISAVVLVAVGLGLYSLGGKYGAVRVESGSEAAPRIGWIYSSTKQAPELFGSASGLTKTIPGAPQTVNLKVPGMPSKQVTVTPWHPVKVLFPDEFTRRVLLVIPSSRLLNEEIQNLQNDMPKLVVTSKGKPLLTIPKYTWFSFWIGCGPDVLVPRYAKARLYHISMQVADIRRYLYATPLSEPDWYGGSSWTSTEKPVEGLSPLRIAILVKDKETYAQVFRVEDKSLEFAQVLEFDGKS